MKTKILLLSLITIFKMATATAQNVPGYVPKNGLVGWWPLDGDADDKSGNGHNGVLSGTTFTSDRSGSANSCLQFDGKDDYGTIPYSPNLSPSLGTVALWFKANGQVNTQKLLFGQSWGRPQLVIRDNSNGDYNAHKAMITWGTKEGKWQGVNSVSAVDNDSWVFVVGIFDKTEFKIYINGVWENNSTTFPDMLQYTCDSPLQFGGFNISDHCGFGKYVGQFFDGKIDDIGMWNRALTENEITELYNGTAKAPNTEKTQRSPIIIGAKLGANFNSFANLPSNSTGLSYSNNGLGTGFLVGGFIRIGLGSFYLQPELVYTQRTGKLTTTVLGVNVNSTTTVGYIDVPVLFGRSFIGDKLRLNLGPLVSLPVNSKVEVDGGSGSSSVSDLQSPQFGYQVGAGTDLGKFTIDLRYEGYFSDISTKSPSPRYNGFQLSLGYKFLDK